MQIDIFRKPKDTQQMLKEYFEDLQNAVVFHGDTDKMARHVLYICNGGTHGDAKSDITQIDVYPERYEGGITLSTDELREIYEVLNANGFRWER